jgi:hypothetical protein
MFRLSTPATQNDFPHDPGAFETLCAQWDTNLTGFTLQAITGSVELHERRGPDLVNLFPFRSTEPDLIATNGKKHPSISIW